MARRIPRPRHDAGWERYYAVVRHVPTGRVATYGQIAALAGRPGHARQVGYALFALRGEQAEDVPWHRVVNAKGEISQRSDAGPENLQRAMLEAEEVEFDLAGRISLRRYRWDPDL
jgi:methylated-DNA-protein-cysteine methyltransferase-like protein